MGRPAINPEDRRIKTQLQPPLDLPAPMVKLWHAEFGRFPPGYFVPADIVAMLTYLEIRKRYFILSGMATDMLERGRPPEKGLNVALTSTGNQMIRLQHALRMFPSNRARPSTFGNKANDAGIQADDPNGAADWRSVMAQARETIGSKVTTLPVAKRGPGRPRKIQHDAG